MASQARLERQECEASLEASQAVDLFINDRTVMEALASVIV